MWDLCGELGSGTAEAICEGLYHEEEGDGDGLLPLEDAHGLGPKGQRGNGLKTLLGLGLRLGGDLLRHTRACKAAAGLSDMRGGIYSTCMQGS